MSTERSGSGGMREILRCDEPARAHLVAGFLESHGIPAEVVGDQTFWADGSMVPKDMRPTVRVAVEHAAEASRLLAELDANRETGTAWVCGPCDEFVPPAFTECPVCGTVRPPRKAR